MKKSNILTFGVALLASASLQAVPTVKKKKADQKRPNIILMMADDQGWGDTGYNGHPYLKTPALDNMAKNGVRFNRFYAGSSVCSPTRASVMTGRHPLRMEICTANCGHVKAEEITMAEMLKEYGYKTGHFGKWHLGTLTKDILDANRGGKPQNVAHYAPPWEHGFDECFSTESKVPTYNPMITPSKKSGDVSKHLAPGKPFGTYYWTGAGEKVTDNLEGDDSKVIMDRAIPFIEKVAKDDEPFFVVIWFHTPHLPVVAGKDFRDMYSEHSDGQQNFYGCVSALDVQVGRLRDKLKELGVDENTMLWYTSDNGPEGKKVGGPTQGLTNGLRGRKRSLHDGGIRVPGILEWPGHVEAGKVVNAPCFTSDYFPTVANVIGKDLEDYKRPYDGIDILPIVEGKQNIRGNYMAFEYKGQGAYIGDRYKLYTPDVGKTFELYDMLIDPTETKDISSDEPELLSQLVSEWENWHKSQQKSAKGLDY